MRTMVRLLMIGLICQPGYATYPVVDVPDLVLDTQSWLVRIEETAAEIEHYIKMVEEYQHWVKQAEKMRDRNVWRLKTLKVYTQAGFGQRIIELSSDMETFLQAADGLFDLRREADELDRAVRAIFKRWSDRTGAVDTRGPNRVLLQAQAEEQRFALGVATNIMSWVGGVKHSLTEEQGSLGHGQGLFEMSENTSHGRQHGYDLIGGHLVTLQGLRERSLRMQQASSQIKALRGLVEINERRRQLGSLERKTKDLELLEEDIKPAEPGAWRL